MTTRSGNTYNPMGNPTNIPSSSNPSDPPSDMTRLEDAFKSFATDMRAQVAEIKKDLNNLRSMTNQRLTELEHPDQSLQRTRGNPSQDARLLSPPRPRSMPLPTYQPPYVVGRRTHVPPPFEYGYPPPGYDPYTYEPRPFPPEQRPRHREFRQPPFEDHPYPQPRERYFPPNHADKNRDQGYRQYNAEV